MRILSLSQSMRLSLQLALLTTLWFLTIAPGNLGNGDTGLRLQMTHAWLFGTPEVKVGLPKPASREDIDSGIVGVDGKRHIFYDPGQSILMIPGDWLGAKLQRLSPVRDSTGLREWIVAGVVFLPSNVALVLTCFWLIRLLGFSESLSAVTSLLWLIATTVLPYAQVSFQNNQVLLFAMLSYALILASIKSRWRNALFVSGAAAGMTMLIRTSAAIHALTAALFLLGCLRTEKTSLRDSLVRIGTWIAGAVPFVIAGRLFDYHRYGSLFATGQSIWLARINSDPIFAGLPKLPASFPFVNSAFEGIGGVLFSSAKSIFIYDPLLLPCIVVGVVAWKTLNPYLRWFAASAVVNIALHIALTSELDFWHGDWAWAARYHVSSVELLLVCLLPLLIQRALETRSAAAYVLRGCLLVGIAVQMLAVSMPADVEIVPELVQEPVMCDSVWDSRLEFRLGHRVRDLYCLASKASLNSCPAVAANRAERDHPLECEQSAQEIRRANHLAFFPFDPSHRLVRYGFELEIWSALAGLTLIWTGLWLYRAFRGPARHIT